MARRRIDVLAAACIAALGVAGLFDMLVLLPGALAPSTSLPEAWEEVGSTGDLVPVLAGPAVWGLLCAVSAARHLRARPPRSSLIAGGSALVEIGTLAALVQVAAFGMGLWLSNHLPPFEGGTTGLEDAALLLGVTSIAGGFALLVIASVRRRAHRSAAA